jgi:hypothetical protein
MGLSRTVEYSEAEKTLIKSISEHWYEIIHQTNIVPINVYRALAVTCFLENRTGPEVEALRRVVSAIEECKIYRMTPEFDDLCKIDLRKK